MSEVNLPPPAAHGLEDEIRRTGGRARRRWTLALLMSVGSGLASALTGLALGTVSYLGVLRSAHSVNRLGNLLIVAAFPLMMFGAHALDKINESARRQKTAATADRPPAE